LREEFAFEALKRVGAGWDSSGLLDRVRLKLNFWRKELSWAFGDSSLDIWKLALGVWTRRLCSSGLKLNFSEPSGRVLN